MISTDRALEIFATALESGEIHGVSIVDGRRKIADARTRATLTRALSADSLVWVDGISQVSLEGRDSQGHKTALRHQVLAPSGTPAVPAPVPVVPQAAPSYATAAPPPPDFGHFGQILGLFNAVNSPQAQALIDARGEAAQLRAELRTVASEHRRELDQLRRDQYEAEREAYERGRQAGLAEDPDRQSAPDLSAVTSLLTSILQQSPAAPAANTGNGSAAPAANTGDGSAAPAANTGDGSMAPAWDPCDLPGELEPLVKRALVSPSTTDFLTAEVARAEQSGVDLTGVVESVLTFDFQNSEFWRRSGSAARTRLGEVLSVLEAGYRGGNQTVAGAAISAV